MVARKMRDHCATCGKRYETPTTWAYCSKACEHARSGYDRSDSGAADAWLLPIHEERLRLRVQLENAPRRDHTELLTRIAQAERREATMRDAITAGTGDRSKIAYWVPILRRESDSFEVAMRRSLAVAIRLGSRLIEAKAALPYGEFGRLFRDHDDAVPSALPYTRSWGGKLMSIASNGVTRKAAHAQHLPSDIETVYVLSRMPAIDLEAAIQAGSVSPAMRRGDARRLLAGDAEPSEPDEADLVAELIGPIHARLVRFAADHPELMQDAATRLKGILRGICRVASQGAS
jgi:hypothetical protein